MVTLRRQLSNRLELVESLDPELVFDYLIQHGVLDQAIVDQICIQEKRSERNVALLKHIEQAGSSATDLFINALRQSGQLHLASSLDEARRIKPVCGSGYWGKQRYKGQVTVTVQMVAAKLLIPRGSDEDNSISMDNINIVMTPRRLHQSYDDMTMIEVDNNIPKARKILEYSYDTEDEEEQSKSCWCRCLPFLCCSKSKSKQKRSKVKGEKGAKTGGKRVTLVNGDKSQVIMLETYPSVPCTPQVLHTPIKSGSTHFKSNYSSPSKGQKTRSQKLPKSDSVDRNSNHQLNEILQCAIAESPTGETVPSVQNHSKGEVTRSSSKGSSSRSPDKCKKGKGAKKEKKKTRTNKDLVEMYNNQRNEAKSALPSPVNGESVENKENNDPCIWDMQGATTPESAVKQNGTSSPSKSDIQSGGSPASSSTSESIEYVERWKSDGPLFEDTQTYFFSLIDTSVQGKIVKYFEQDRGTLVVQILDENCLAVCNICMTLNQVHKLEEEYESGKLHEELEKVIGSQEIVDKLKPDCCAIHLRTVIDPQDFSLAVQELS